MHHAHCSRPAGPRADPRPRGRQPSGHARSPHRRCRRQRALPVELGGRAWAASPRLRVMPSVRWCGAPKTRGLGLGPAHATATHAALGATTGPRLEPRTDSSGPNKRRRRAADRPDRGLTARRGTFARGGVCTRKPRREREPHLVSRSLVSHSRKLRLCLYSLAAGLNAVWGPRVLPSVGLRPSRPSTVWHCDYVDSVSVPGGPLPTPPTPSSRRCGV